MKLIISLLFFFAAFFANSQNSFNMIYDWDLQFINEQPLSDDMKGVVSEVRVKKTYSKDKRNKSIQKHYDDNGLVTVYEVNDRDGAMKWKNEVQYNAKGNVSLYKSYSPKGLRVEKINTYDDQLRLTETLSKGKKGQITQRNTWTYGSGKCPLSSNRYKKGGQKINRSWAFSFYKDCDPSKTVLSNGKGKVLKTWTYDCKKEGEQLVKKKDETQVCKYDESDGKYLTRVYQNFDEKGRIQKTVQKYTIEDTLIVESISYDGADKLKWKITYDKSFDRQISFVTYNKKGEETFRRESLYIDKKIQSTASLNKGKKSSETFYSYNDKNWLTKIENFDKKDRKTSSSEFEYVLL